MDAASVATFFDTRYASHCQLFLVSFFASGIPAVDGATFRM